jgi:hypothetical protein
VAWDGDFIRMLAERARGADIAISPNEKEVQMVQRDI